MFSSTKIRCKATSVWQESKKIVFSLEKNAQRRMEQNSENELKRLIGIIIVLGEQIQSDFKICCIHDAVSSEEHCSVVWI